MWVSRTCRSVRAWGMTMALGTAALAAGAARAGSVPAASEESATIAAAVTTTMPIAVITVPATQPVPPQELAATANEMKEVELSWKAVSTTGKGFKIERSPDGQTGWAEIGSTAADATRYVDKGLADETRYFYRVLRVDALGNTSDPSAVADVLTKRHKNLLETLQGKNTLTLDEIIKPQFWQQSVNDFVLGALGFIPKLVVAFILFALFYLIYRGVRRIVIGSMTKAHVDPSIRDMLSALLRWSIMGFGLVIACNQIGIQIAALLTGVSIIGLAIGFAAQETLANFIAGVVIFWDKPFKVGDWITIDSQYGQVLRVSFRSTRMLNVDGQTIVMPNTYMLASRVANHSAHPMNRLNIPIGIAYKESIDDARAALLAVPQGDARVRTDPAPSVVVNECADSSVNLLLRIWIEDESQERAIYFEYLEKAKKALDAAGIEIPFPHMQLFLENTPATASLGARDGARSTN